MRRTNSTRRPVLIVWSSAIGTLLALAGASAESPSANAPALATNAAASLPHRIVMPDAPSGPRASADQSATPAEHPLAPVLRWAKEGLPAIETLQDYSATFVRRERVQGRLSGYEYMAIKIRHQPFSVFARFEAPESVQGQEVIYVAGQNQGNMWAHKPRMSVTFSIHPEGLVAMSGRNYPITEIGLVNLVRRLVEVGERDVHQGDCEVKYFLQAKVGKRPCTVIQVLHPTPRDDFQFHLARIFVDDELKMPIRYEAYTWPRTPDGDPQLLEEFTYLDLKLNNGFTDEDFSVSNPEYHFGRPSAESNQRAEAR